MTADNQKAKLWWAVPAATGLLLMGVALVFGKPPEQAKARTSYDASSDGFRAAYLLLDELGYAVERSKRPAGGAARLLLFPDASQDKAYLLDSWIREGGILILGVDKPEFAGHLGMSLKIQTMADPGQESASGAGIARLAGGTIRVEWPGQAGEVWAKAGEQPAVTMFQRGRGEIWLLNRPQLLTNRQLPQADNAVLLCRLAEAAVHKRSGKLAFDEYFHGMHERPGVAELLFEPPTLWVTLQGLALLGVVLWHFAPRFGTPRPAVVASRRRSKEEFLDAMASLLERKGDYTDSFRTAWEDFVREIGRELGLPAGTPVDRILDEAERRRPDRLVRFRRLRGQAPVSRLAFVKALQELESARGEFFHERPHRDPLRVGS
jgi:hypothetical protein